MLLQQLAAADILARRGLLCFFGGLARRRDNRRQALPAFVVGAILRSKAGLSVISILARERNEEMTDHAYPLCRVGWALMT